MQILLVLPPLTQLNSPYPSTGYLTRFMRKQNYDCTQRDLGIELALRVFSQQGLRDVFDQLEETDELPEAAWRALAMRTAHEACIEPIVAFLQGRDRTLARRILDTPFLPTGPRLAQADLSQFGTYAVDDAARFLATQYIEDLADLVTSCIDSGFALTSYQKHLATGSATFAPIQNRLDQTTLIDTYLDELTDSICADVVGISVPFPGNLYSALRIGQKLRKRDIYVVAGGGYINTELRDINEPKIWEYFDALTYDNGEGPLLAIVECLQGKGDRRHRTKTQEGTHQKDAPRPPTTWGATYHSLNQNNYLSLVDTINPTHRLWGEGPWNKITLAHGCYWKKCSFCDTGLDYVSRYEKSRAPELVRTIEEQCVETGIHGFHFVDEAAPPAVMKELAIEILRRRLTITWWGNIRFETTYTPDLCRLLSAAGLIAVTGGLEVASDRLLKQMRKGVSIDQVTQAASAFRQAGIMVHTYLMYGFPTQTSQETIDSMELVKQLFQHDLISSAFWHRFVLTKHSPMYQNPNKYGIVIPPVAKNRFATNDLPHLDPHGANHDVFDPILPQALDAWMRGEEFTRPVENWFDAPMPPTTEPADRIERVLSTPPSCGERLLWIGGEIIRDTHSLTLHHRDDWITMNASENILDWLEEVVEAARPDGDKLFMRDIVAVFPGDWNAFSQQWALIRQAGLLRI